jgi:hypothetical protein
MDGYWINEKGVYGFVCLRIIFVVAMMRVKTYLHCNFHSFKYLVVLKNVGPVDIYLNIPLHNILTVGSLYKLKAIFNSK